MLYLKYALSLSLAFLGAYLAQWFRLPIPWLLGPLFITALLKINHAPIECHSSARSIGLMIIGLTLGLYFTPEMLHLITSHWFVLLVGLVSALFFGTISAFILKHWANMDFKTAWFASAIGGANEMSHLAEHYHARVEQVASAHTLRVLMVVVIVPFFYQLMGWHGFDTNQIIRNVDINWFGFFILIFISYLSSRAFVYFKLPNPWTFGALLVAIFFTAQNIHLSAVPPAVIHLGQVLLGWSLGNKFKPGFFKKAPRFLSIVALSNLGIMLLAGVVAYGLMLWTDIPIATLGLGLAPGGVAEMTITANVLQLGVPLVTAFHVVRMVGVLGTVGYLYVFFEKIQNRSLKK